MATMTVTELRARMREAVERVKSGDEIRITQNGEVAAVLVHPARLRPRAASDVTAQAAMLAEELRRRRANPGPLLPGVISAARAEELIEAVRAGREAR